MGDNSINDKFYDLSDKSLNLNIKRFYIPQKIETLKTTLLLKELIKRFINKFKKNEKKLIYCFDIDGVICNTKGKNYTKAKPILKAIKKINYLYDQGHLIKIFTARYMGRNSDNIRLAEKQGYKKTYAQLKKWKIKFHQLIIGKPSFDIFVDDKAFGFKKTG